MATKLDLLTDMEILQMQWDILEQVKQQRANIEIETPKDSEIPIIDLNTATDKVKSWTVSKDTPKKRTHTILEPVILPNGIKLARSHCKLYNKIEYGGNGVIKLYNNRKLSLTIGQLIDVLRNFDKIPKDTMESRIKWCEHRYGVQNITQFDRIIYNLYKGTFTDVFKTFYNKNYRINFNSNGELIIGE